MPRPSNTDERRSQIVEGLMKVMSTSGYNGATIPLIASAAGLTPGLVHYHFKSKQEILIELVTYLVAFCDHRFEKIKATDARSRLAAYIDANLASGQGSLPEAVACWVNIGAEAVRQMEVREVFQKASSLRLSMLESLVESLLKSEQRKLNKKREIALGIYAAIEGSFSLLISAPNMIPSGFAAATVKEMAFGLIALQPVVSGKSRR